MRNALLMRFVIAEACLITPTLTHAQYMYWTVHHAPCNEFSLGRAGMDGSNKEFLFSPRSTAIGIDPVDRKIYWWSDNSLMRSSADGSDTELFLDAAACLDCFDFLIEPLGRHLYYAVAFFNSSDGTRAYEIRRMGLDGNNDELVVALPPSTTDLRHFDLHLPSNSIYWLMDPHGTSTSQLWRAHLDGSNVQNVMAIEDSPIAFKIDSIHGALYWWLQSFNVPIFKAELEVWSPHALQTVEYVTELVVDPQGEKVYLANYNLRRFQRTSLDGSNSEDVLTLNSPDFPGELVLMPFNDCNGNGIDDWCELSCGQPGGYCDVPGCGTSLDANRNGRLDVCDDCNGNGLPDSCDVNCGPIGGVCDIPGCGLGSDCNSNGKLDDCDLLSTRSFDCNANQILDECELTSGTSLDCNLNSVPDECEALGADCNNNGVRDDCDALNGPSEDCNLNLIPDECETLGADCNNNGIRDDCDTLTGSSDDCNHNLIPDECEAPNADCNSNGIPDECELAGADCNANILPDQCDIASGTSIDTNANGIPDECEGEPAPPVSDPSGLAKSRMISFVVSQSETESEASALRVRLVSLHHVTPPYTGGPMANLSAFEGQFRWVGPPIQYREATCDVKFSSSALDCTPHYQDWSTVSLLHVYGSSIVPSSVYEVQRVGSICAGAESNCMAISAPLTIVTTRWGDVEQPYNPPSTTTQPDLGDVAALVNKFKGVPGAPIKARALLAGDDAFGNISPATLSLDLGFGHIAACVDAFKGKGYPFAIQACP